MNAWSTYIQSPEELDLTRKSVFSESNDVFWKNIFSRIDSPKKILEVGCGGGILSRKLSQLFPNALIYGIDYDSGHIEYAKKKSIDLGISNCFYEIADAHSLPFENNEFDICISHTVMNFCEPHRFLSEQNRVLRNGGMVVVCLAKYRRCINPLIWMPTSGEEYELIMRLKEKADASSKTQVFSYHTSEKECLHYLAEEGFSEIRMQFLPNIIYFPDNCDLTVEEGIAEIRDNLTLEKIYIEKLIRVCPDILSEHETERLIELMNDRYSQRMKDLISNVKQWDFSVSFTFVASAINSN